MVFTIHRYIFRELLRVFVLTAVALTLMMSLGSILRPVQEFGVGPEQVIHLMGYFLPITLTFVLPMAALFACSLVYGRFAGDNELDACRASGISMFTVMYPGIVLAILVAIANLMLSFHVMPSFVMRAEKSLKADAKQIIFRSIERKGYYRSPDKRYMLYADQVDILANTMAGVVIIERSKDKIERVIATQQAKVEFNPHSQGKNEVQIVVQDMHQMAADEQMWFSAERLSISEEFGPLMSDDIKFKKIEMMKEIAADPLSFSPVEKEARAAYAQFTAELLAQDINRRLGESQESVYRLFSGAQLIDIRANKVIALNGSKVEFQGDVRAMEYSSNNKPLRDMRCERAVVSLEGDEFAPTLTLELRSVSWYSGSDPQSLATRIVVRGLVVPSAVTNQFRSEDVLISLREDAVRASLKEPSKWLLGTMGSLTKRVIKTFKEIRSEVHSRLVFGVGCIPMIVIGIGLGIRMRGGHMLVAFGASCLPAAILIVCMMSGKQLAEKSGMSGDGGIYLMWGGCVFLYLFAIWLYRKVQRG